MEEDLENDIPAQEDNGEETEEKPDEEETDGKKQDGENLEEENPGGEDLNEKTAEKEITDEELKMTELMKAPVPDKPEEEEVSFLTAETGDYFITLSSGEAIFPEEACLEVKQVDDADTVEELSDILSKQEGRQAAAEELVCFDMAVLDSDGQEMDLGAQEGSLRVTFEKLAAELNDGEEEPGYQIYQADRDNQDVEKKDTSVDGSIVEAEVDDISRVVLRAAGAEGAGARAGEVVTVTSADELKTALEAAASTTICVDENIAFGYDTVAMSANQTLKIAEGKELELIKRLNVAKMITFTGAGTVRLTGAGERFRGRMAVGDSVRVIVEDTSSIYPNGEMTIRNGAVVEIKSPQGINAVDGKQIIIEEGGILTGTEGAGIVLVEGATVTNKNTEAVFQDQGKACTTADLVTVGPETAAAAENQLTAGTYLWDAKENCFCKPAAETPDEGVRDAATLIAKLAEAKTATIRVAEDIILEEEASLGANQILNIAEGKTLTIQGNGKIDTRYDKGDGTISGRRLTITGEGNVRLAGEGELLSGSFTLGEGKEGSTPTVTVGKAGSILVDKGSIVINAGASLILQSPTGILAGRIQTIQINGGTLTGEDGSGIVLGAGAVVQGAGDKFSDQGRAFSVDTPVTVGAETAAAADNQLTAGSYVWDGTRFSKAKADLAAMIKELLEDTEKINTIRIEEDVTFDQQAVMVKNQVLEIAAGRTLAITGRITTTEGSRLTFQGEGTVVIGDAGCVEGRVYVGNEKNTNSVSVILRGNKSLVSSSNLGIAPGARLQVDSPEGLVTSGSSQIQIYSGGVLTSTGNGGITLAAKAKVTDENAGGVFSDQGKALAVNTQVTVGGSGEAPADNQLTAGVYLWNGTCFFKEEPDPLPPTRLEGGILYLGNEAVNAGSDQGWAWEPANNTLNVNQRFKEVKQIRFLKDEAASMRVNAGVTLTPDAGQEAILAPNNLLFRADNENTLTINGPVSIGGKAEVINKITLNLSGSSPEALLKAGGDIMIKGNSVVHVTNQGAGAAILGRGITIKEEAELHADGKGSGAVIDASGSIGIGGPSASVSAVNHGTGMAMNKAPGFTEYPDVQISVSASASGRPGVDYNAADILNYRYVKFRKPVEIGENSTAKEIEEAADLIEEGDLDAIDVLIAQIHNLNEEEKEKLNPQTVERLDEMLQKAGVKLIQRLDVAPAGVEANKQIQKSRIYGALIAAGLDTNAFGKTVEFAVTQVDTEEGAAATFVCSLTIDGQEAAFGLPVTLRVGLPPEYFPLSKDQIHLTGRTPAARSALSARTVRAASSEIDRWLDFTYHGADNTAEFRTDVLGTFSLVRKGSSIRPGGSGGSSSGGGGGGGGGASKGPGQVVNPAGPSSADGAWIKDDRGWWYRYNDQTYPRDGWFQLEYAGKREWYYFDQNGYMVTGWVFHENRWYYLNPASDGTQGRMLTGWQYIDGKWYYLNENPDGTQGARFADTWIGEYYVDKDGRWDEKRKKKS